MIKMNRQFYSIRTIKRLLSARLVLQQNKTALNFSSSSRAASFPLPFLTATTNLNRISSEITVNDSKKQYTTTTTTMNNPKLVEQKFPIKNGFINYLKCGANSLASTEEKEGTATTISKNCVLLLPGALGSIWTDFTPQINGLPKLLTNDYTIIVWDPPGYGKSRPPDRNFTVDFYAEDAQWAAELMNGLGYRKYSVCGWSDGGITGMIMAAKYPTIIDKLVVWGSNAYTLETELKIYEGIRDVSKWSKKMREPMENVYGRDYFPKLWNEWVDIMIKMYYAKGGNICRDILDKIVAPTLIVHGCKDPNLASEHIPYLRQAIRNTEYYEFPDGKHNIHLRYPDEFNRIVAEFLWKTHGKL